VRARGDLCGGRPSEPGRARPLEQDRLPAKCGADGGLGGPRLDVREAQRAEQGAGHDERSD
jgi:hypothetical protein